MPPRSGRHSPSTLLQDWKKFKDVPRNLFSICRFPVQTVIPRDYSLLPLCYWHEFLDLVFFFKMVNNLVIIEPSVVPKTRSARPTRSSINTDIPKFVIPRSKTTTRQRSFLFRTTRVWNSLADELKVNMINLNSFKSTILSYYFRALEISCDPENPRTFKTICTKCNTARTLV